LNRLGRLAPKDLEHLSAYLDQALSARERADLDARLEAEPELRLALSDLQFVKMSLAGLPERRPSRSFALREADVARRAPGQALPALRFATIVASALFVLTTAVRSLSLPIMPLAAAPEAQFAAQVQDELQSAVAATEMVGELRAEAPAAAAEAGMADELEPVGTPTAAGTDCPDCPSTLTTAKAEIGQDAAEAVGQRDLVPGAITPLVAAQWILGLATIGLGLLTLRARRR
jgi:hypothetical protein